MQKREVTLLVILGIVAVIAVVVFVSVDALRNVEPIPALSQTDQALSSTALRGALAGGAQFLQGSKFTSLTTYGRIPVIVSSEEVGTEQPIRSAI